MSVNGGLGLDYSMYLDDFLYDQQMRYANYGTGAYYNQYGGVATTVSNNNNYTSIFKETAENSCTDGVNDGKISFGSKVANLAEGVWDMGVNAVKTAIKNPIQTALAIGACCIPVVGPFIGGAMAIGGIVNGVKQVGTAIQVANSATTDAEAKAAWENIGSGAGATALSAVALKGSAGLLKSQGTTAISAYNGLKASGATTGQIVTAGIKGMAQGTMSNIAAVVKAPFKAAEKMYDDYVNVSGQSSLSWNGVKTYAGAKWNGIVQKVTGFIDDFADDAGNAIDNRSVKKGNDSALRDQEILDGQRIEVDSKTHTSTNKNVKWNKEKGVYELTENGTTTIYDKNGVRTGTSRSEVWDVDGKPVTIEEQYASNGDIAKTTTTQEGNGWKSQTVVETGKQTTYEATRTVDGKTTQQINSTTNNQTGVTNTTVKSGKTKTTSTTVNGQGGQTGYVKYNGKTVWMKDGVVLENPTMAQKMEIRALTNNQAIKLNQALDNPFAIMGIEIPNEVLMGLGVAVNLEE